MIKGIWILLLVVSFISSAQKKETVYLLFEQEKESSCNYIIQRNKRIIPVTYTQKRHRKVNVTRYILCKNTFVFEFQKQDFSIVDASATTDYKIVDLDYILTKQKEANYKNINDLFEVFILEKIENNQFAKYEVVWEKALY